MSNYLKSNLLGNNNQLVEIRLENLSADPSGYTGKIYFNTSTLIPKFFDGTVWKEFSTGTGVTSVGLSAPSIFSVSGSPITTSGTLSFSLNTQSSNLVFAGPSSGTSSQPTFRSLVTADIPNLDASKITSGVFSTSRLGTGSASSTTWLRGDGTWETIPVGATELNDLSDVNISTPTSNQLLMYNGSVWTNWTPDFLTSNETIVLSGDVTGSGSTTIATTISNNVVTFAKMQDIATQTLLGRHTSGTGDPETITLGSGLTLSTAGVLSSSGAGGTVTSVSSGSLSPLFTTSVTNPTTTPSISYTLSSAPANTWFGNSNTSSSAPIFNSASALSVTSDSNIILTLTGTPATALLKSTGITVSWNGVLSVARGGTGLSTLGTAGQLLRVNTAGSGIEFFTPSYLTSNQTITWTGTGDVTGTGSGTTTISPSLTIANNAVTFSKIQDIPTMTLIGRTSSGTGDPSSVSIIDDDTMSTATSSNIPTSESIKTYVDNLVSGIQTGNFIGGFDASTQTTFPVNPASSGTLKGDYWYVTQAGTVQGIPLQVNDMLIAIVNGASTTSSSDWVFVQGNTDQATSTVLGLVMLATQAEVNAGTNSVKAVTPSTLSSYLGSRCYKANIGNGSLTSITVTHNLGDTDVIVQIKEVSTGIISAATTTIVDSNNVKFDFTSAPATNGIRVVILKTN